MLYEIDKIDKDSVQRLVKSHNEASRYYCNLDSYEKLMLKRTINTACSILDDIEGTTLEKLGIVIFMKTSDKEFIQFIKRYEYQLEEAIINPERFVRNLHSFFLSSGKIILDSNIRDFFEFLDFVERHSRNKVSNIDKKITDAYVNLLLQQCLYLSVLKGHKEKLICGLTTDNEIIFKDDIFPYCDCGSYELEEEIQKSLSQGKTMDINIIKSAYKKYGYNINSLIDIKQIDSKCRSFSNMHYFLMNYISEHTLQILPTIPYNNIEPINPREWVSTDLLIDLLSRRKYILPSNGVMAHYFNAGMYNKVLYQEVYVRDRIILLYKVISDLNGEFCGFYDTKTHDFYSIYERSNFDNVHEQCKNFILENYYTLTCEPSIDRKRLTILKQVEDINVIDSYYAKQPVVCYTYKQNNTSRKNKAPTYKQYNREDYQSERKAINGFIRKLPEGQQASYEAKQFAIKLGYELKDDETFVRPFEKYVLKIKAL